MRAGIKTEVSMIRTLIGAIENAEAVEAEGSVDPKIGLDHDQPRRVLGEGDVLAILRGERKETLEAAQNYRDLGLVDEAADLDARLEIMDRYLGRMP